MRRTIMTPIPTYQLQSLVAAWRAKARAIEEKFEALDKAQTDVAVEAINGCAQDLEDLIK